MRRLLPDSLLARSFLLIALLLVVSVLAAFQLYRIYEREPLSRELAQQAVSVVNLTRAALVNAAPALRPDLLLDLNESEGIRLYPVTPGEQLEPLPDDPLFKLVAERVRRDLGARTRFAFARNGVAGFWVSFFIDVDEYWVMLPRARFEPQFGLEWLGWGAALLALALLGAALIATRINRPLGALTQAARRVGRGEMPEPLDVQGPRELRTLSSAFNRMARDLQALERERATVLAGISHDLRTPLSRLRLELEMSGAERAAAESMATDIDDIDAIIGQFLDYARGESEAPHSAELDALGAEIAEHYARRGRKVSFVPGGVPPFPFATMALRRAIANLVDNALRYAGEPVEIVTRAGGDKAIVEVLDRGPGIPPGETERLKRPFTRLDAARGGQGGSGLGLAIVDRVARAHGGTLELRAREGGGLAAVLTLSRAPAAG
ncbi:MAG TPA: ATP-binding protein [Burkholderiales bacterium]|nr:ATP-binding protein [Burkholderiales bacterium]